MNKLLLLSIFILPFIVDAQLTENFSDGDFINNPSWSGNSSQFTVNGSLQLQLNSTAAATSYLYISNNLSTLDNTEWTFWIHLNFSPSSGNFARVFLTSNQSNLNGSLNGYYLQFGESGSNDAVELFRKSGATSTSVCRGTAAEIAAAFTIGIKVTRDATGLWSLLVDPSGGTSYILEASGTDATYTTSAYSGVLCIYTITNATSFYFDDFSFPFQPDHTPPTLSSATVIDSVHLDVKFSEAVDQTSAETPLYYVVGGIGSPSAAVRDVTDLSVVHLTFSTQFPVGVQKTITAILVQDLSLNPIGTTGNSAQFTWYNPQAPDSGDVILNEVLFSAKTGGVEFIELYNRSSKSIYLKDLKITRIDLATLTLDPSVQLTTGNELMIPNGYMVITDNPSIVQSQYYTPDPSAFLQINIPDLLTDEDILVLQGAANQKLDQLHYYSSWHFPLLNDVHGVSLERLNPNRPTQDQTNWHSAAESVGFATPGYKNSQNDNSAGNGDEMNVDPEIFSPDEDGHNDVVNVHYHFSNSGNVANVIVYDSKGRLIRNLVNNELIGNDGSFSWDGVTNSNDKARIGMYIFYIEVFDLKGDTKSFKKTCVLAGKL